MLLELFRRELCRKFMLRFTLLYTKQLCSEYDCGRCRGRKVGIPSSTGQFKRSLQTSYEACTRLVLGCRASDCKGARRPNKRDDPHYVVVCRRSDHGHHRQSRVSEHGRSTGKVGLVWLHVWVKPLNGCAALVCIEAADETRIVADPIRSNNPFRIRRAPSERVSNATRATQERVPRSRRRVVGQANGIRTRGQWLLHRGGRVPNV